MFSGRWQALYEMVLSASMGTTKRQWRLTMAFESTGRGGLPFPGARRVRPARAKTGSSQEMGLVLAIVVLLLWALYVAI
jgi:hypothetical protein